jgi:tRNA pseudouridine38-40 synthase
MRYFLEVSYKGTNYAGFQVQKNANTIQAELEHAVNTRYKISSSLTGSSRTDSGVHALQNFLHLDTTVDIDPNEIYNLNALLPADIVLRKIYRVPDDAHCRFDAVSREYKYYIYHTKNPFIKETAWFYPYPLNMELLEAAAELVLANTNFVLFSKSRTQVKTFKCTVTVSRWIRQDQCLVYNVKANRFLRGMVRALVATMVKVARGKLSLAQLEKLLKSETNSGVDFSAPALGLFLTGVEYPAGLLGH